MNAPAEGGDGPREQTLISLYGLQIAASLGTLAFGAFIVAGAIEYDIGWGERGPDPGYAPFWMGLLVIVGSLGTLVETVIRRPHAAVPALTRAQGVRVTMFVLPMLGFLLVTSYLGLYVAMVAYLLVVMIWQGGYRLPMALLVSTGTALVFFVLFDKWLKVPLMKGPLEAWLGIY